MVELAAIQDGLRHPFLVKQQREFAAVPSFRAAESKAVEEKRPIVERRELALEPERTDRKLDRLCCRVI